MEHIELRKAVLEDSENIRQARNDPITREMFCNSDYVGLEEHQNWYREVLNNDKRLLLIAEVNNNPIAAGRVDIRDDGNAEISLNVFPEERGKGYGAILFKKIAECAVKQENFAFTELLAEVKEKNSASIKALEKAGYEYCGQSGIMLCYKYMNG